MKKDWRCRLLIHEFGSWKIEDDKFHIRTCSRCGFQKRAKHSYNAWKFEDDTYHSRTCFKCGFQESANHNYPESDSRCGWCGGTGQMEMDGGHGEKVYTSTVTCVYCGGTGIESSNEILHCLDCGG